MYSVQTSDSSVSPAITRQDVAAMEHEERSRRIASLQEQEDAFLLAESTSKIIRGLNLSNFSAQSNRGMKRYTLRIEETERGHRIEDKSGMLLEIEKAWCEARMISKLPTYVQKHEVDLCALKYLPAEKEYGPPNSPQVMRARASQLEIIVETSTNDSPEEHERKRRIQDKHEQDLARTKAMSLARSIKRRNSFTMEEAEKNRRLADLALQEQARKNAANVSTSIKRRNSIKLEDEERVRRLSNVSEQDQARIHARLLADKVQRHYAASQQEKAEADNLSKRFEAANKIKNGASVDPASASYYSGYLFQNLFKIFGRADPAIAAEVYANAPGSPAQ